MFRTIITPDTTNVNLPIPEEYLGKKVEILLFSLDESTKNQQAGKTTMASFWGVLNNEDAKELRKQAEQSRNEWDRNI